MPLFEQPKVNQWDSDHWKGTLGALAAGFAVPEAVNGIVSPPLKKINLGGQEARVNAILDRFIARKGGILVNDPALFVSQHIMPAPTSAKGNFYKAVFNHKVKQFAPGFMGEMIDGAGNLKRYVYAPNAAIKAHEVGHLIQGSGLRDPISVLAGKVAPLFGTAGVVASNDEKHALMSATGGSIAAVPNLIAEFDASARGAKMLSKFKGVSKLLPFAGTPTYLALASSPWLAYAAKKLMGNYDKKPIFFNHPPIRPVPSGRSWFRNPEARLGMFNKGASEGAVFEGEEPWLSRLVYGAPLLQATPGKYPGFDLADDPTPFLDKPTGQLAAGFGLTGILGKLMRLKSKGRPWMIEAGKVLGNKFMLPISGGLAAYAALPYLRHLTNVGEHHHVKTASDDVVDRVKSRLVSGYSKDPESFTENIQNWLTLQKLKAMAVINPEKISNSMDVLTGNSTAIPNEWIRGAAGAGLGGLAGNLVGRLATGPIDPRASEAEASRIRNKRRIAAGAGGIVGLLAALKYGDKIQNSI